MVLSDWVVWIQAAIKDGTKMDQVTITPIHRKATKAIRATKAATAGAAMIISIAIINKASDRCAPTIQANAAIRTETATIAPQTAMASVSMPRITL